MDRGNFRSLLSKVGFPASRKHAPHDSLTARRASPASLLAGVGRALGTSGQRSFASLDQLEQRNLLEGSFATAIIVNLDPSGHGSSAGVINPATPSTDNDYFKFTAPQNDFVSVLADTSNEVVASNLNTRVTVYGSPNLSDVIASGTTNGTLTSGVARDGWAGFVAEAGRTYFVVVSSEGAAQGSYTLRLGTKSSTFAIGDEFPTELGIARQPGTFPPPLRSVFGQITQRQGDLIYKYVVPNRAEYDSITTVNAQTTETNLVRRLNTRLDVYNSSGQAIQSAADSDSGRLQDAFTAFKSTPGATYYIRVRSDEVLNANVNVATGNFFLMLDGSANQVALNPVTRRFSTSDAFIGMQLPNPPPSPAPARPTFQNASYSFIAQGDELGIITMQGTGLDPVVDGGLRVYDANGTLVKFVDDFSGTQPEIQTALIGGAKYYVVTDGFSILGGTQFTLDIESNHTFDAAEPLDDHANTPAPVPQNPTPDQINAARRGFDQASAIKFNTPFFLNDADGNPYRDRGQVTVGTGTGRIWGNGDTDLFTFTPPVDMLTTYGGNNDDAGTALYMGGVFGASDPTSAFPVNQHAIGVWDAADYWYAGSQYFDTTFGVTYGFNNNPTTATTTDAQIYVMYDWNRGGASGSALNHVLVVGGDFDLIIPGANGPVTIRNLAFFVWSQVAGRWVWADGGSTDQPVRAATVYDPVSFDPDGGGPSPTIADPAGPRLMIGGDFTNVGGSVDATGAYVPGTAASHIASFDAATGAWAALGAGVPDRVNAFTVWDPPDPGAQRPAQPTGTPPLPQVDDPPDPPISLIIGGRFAGGLATWNGVSIGTLAYNAPNLPATPGTVNGEVFALAVFDDPDPDGPSPAGPKDAANVLIVGGHFTNAGNLTNVGNIAKFGRPEWDPALNDPSLPAYNPRLRWEFLDTTSTARNVGIDDNNAATSETVFALAVWDPPDINNAPNPIPPVLVIGGQFTGMATGSITAGNIAEYGQVPFGTGQPPPARLSNRFFGTGTNDNNAATSDIVRALAVLTDDQEPGVANNLLSGNPQQVLYLGGDFAQVGPAVGQQQPVAARRVAQFSAFHDDATNTDFFNFSALASGVDYIPTSANSKVFALSAFDDGNPTQWDRHDRRQTRAEITVSPTSGAFINTFVRVYDSKFNIIYSNDTKNPLGPDPAGSIDYSVAGAGGAQTFEMPGLWGGETYYIEVSGANGVGVGRYDLSVQVDALPTTVRAGSTVRIDRNAQMLEEGEEGGFDSAQKIDTALATGDGRNKVNSDVDPDGVPLPVGNILRAGRVRPSTGSAVAEGGDLGNISTVTDTDLYYFRAEADGAAEVRLYTTNLDDAFGEYSPDFQAQVRTYSSRLDGALRIFDNDFHQIGYFDDNPASTGEFQQDAVGTLPLSDPANANSPVGGTFFARDPRAVFNVRAGNIYYVQVESGQRYKNPLPEVPTARVANIDREIDYRYATGSYALIVNDMPQNISDVENGLPVVDDHTDFAPATDGSNVATPVPISDAGFGSVNGVINNTPANAVDSDWMTFFVPGAGAVTISLVPTSSTLIGNLQVGRVNPQSGALELVINGSGNGRPGEVVSGSFTALPGEQYFVLVQGFSNTEGSYRVDITTGAAVDDSSSFPKFANASDVVMRDFLGTGIVEGNLERPGDTDIFRFTAKTFGTYSVTVEGLDPTMRPAVTVYELNEDANEDFGLADPNNPLFMRVGINDNVNGVATVQTRFPVTPDRELSVPAPNPDRSYPYYYVVIRGFDPNSDQGHYRLTIGFPATDDHPDADTNSDGVYDTGEYSFASPIVIDSTTGNGLATGTIEVPEDSDLFKFTAVASGEATVVISRPSSSNIRPMVSILDQNAAVITSSIGADDATFFAATVNFNVVRGTTYYIAVQAFEDPLVPNVNTQDFGAYTVSLNSTPQDDYPNATEYSNADVSAVITLNSVTGAGQLGGDFIGDGIVNPRIQPANDTDLFTFTTIYLGNQTITVTPFNTPTGRLAPKLTVLSSTGTPIQSATATAVFEPASITLTNIAAGVKFYLLVEAAPLPGSTLTGEYRIRVAGPESSGGGGGGGGTDPGNIDFNSPTNVNLNSRTGDGNIDDLINVSGDRDLFVFTAPAAGRTYVQVTTPQGSLLDASVRVQSAPNELSANQVAFDSDGIPGVTAYASFVAEAGHRYWVIVDGIGDTSGSYQLSVNTQPATNFLYFPEGFASNSIREFISIDNPNTNSGTAHYTVKLRYEVGDIETVISDGFVNAGSRGGLTVIDGSNFESAGIRKDVPYSIVIESDKPLGATLAHYDFGNAIGDSFTERVTRSWTFAHVERDPGNVLDFIVLYNPANFDINVTLTAQQTDQTAVSVTKSVGAQRRSGFSITDMPTLPRGVFSVTLTAEAVNPSDQASFEGIVASLSHYTAGGAAAYGLLGDPDGGSNAGSVNNFLQNQFAKSEVTFYNPGNAPATVTLTGTYIRASLPQFSRTFDVKAGGQVTFTSADFGLIADQPVGIKYVSNQRVVVSSDTTQQGDADGSTATGLAGVRYVFGDAFIDPKLAGSKFLETLYIYNPTNVTNTITVRLDFADGSPSRSFGVTVAARRYAEVKLHERVEITSRTSPTWYSIELSSGAVQSGGNPFTVTMVHYDLLLGGGWSTTPVPIGFVNPIARIP